jgi:tetratricopeptide (TPR) repeat protein
METFQRAADLAKRLKSPEGLARAALGSEEARWRFNLPAEPAVRLLEEALDTLDKEDSVSRCRVLASLARALLYISPERSAALVRQAIAMARRINDPSAVLDALHVSLFTLWGPEKIKERIAAVNEMLRLAQEVDNCERILEGRAFRIFALLELGDIQAVDTEIEAHDRMAKMLQQPVYIITDGTFRAMRALLDGRFEQAERLIKQTMDIAQSVQDDTVAAGAVGIQMFTLRMEQGRLRELAPIVKSFVEQHSVASAWRPGLAMIYSELGLEPEARAEFEYLAANDFTDIPKDALWMTCIVYLSEVCAFLGDTVRAATLYQLLLPYAGHTVVVANALACYGAVSRYLGLLAATMSRWEEAEKHFEDALAMNARMGAKPWLARTQHEYAEMLLARGRAEDRVKAMSLLDEALTISRELGMKSVVEKVQALKKKFS